MNTLVYLLQKWASCKGHHAFFSVKQRNTARGGLLWQVPDRIQGKLLVLPRCCSSIKFATELKVLHAQESIDAAQGVVQEVVPAEHSMLSAGSVKGEQKVSCRTSMCISGGSALMHMGNNAIDKQ